MFLFSSWQRRGFSSVNGVVTVISIENGIILDTETICKLCKACNAKEKLKEDDLAAYNLWKSNHECSVNYTGSAPNMEPLAAKRIFERSVEKYGLRNMDNYGDGDSKSYMQVINVYPCMEITKYEYIGHVQKRVGCRLRNVVRRNKRVGGKGKLSLATIDKLQNYYGIAIRTNIGNLAAMKKGILASLFHVA